jgi:uncharacterized membrane protein YsdA (DUF1294 family)
MKPFLFLFLLFNLITFLVFGYDKYLARTHRRRISEKTLIKLALFGGSMGAVFAQKFFRHKSQKYRYLFWIILVIQLSLFELVWFLSSHMSLAFRSFYTN